MTFKSVVDAERIAANMAKRIGSHAKHHDGCDVACGTFRAMGEKWREAANYAYGGLE